MQQKNPVENVSYFPERFFEWNFVTTLKTRKVGCSSSVGKPLMRSVVATDEMLGNWVLMRVGEKKRLRNIPDGAGSLDHSFVSQSSEIASVAMR